jgi:hypothetical protein
VESRLGPLGTSATEWPLVPAPDDYDDREFGGMKIGKENRSTRRKPAPAPLCPPQIPLDPCRRCGKPATNRLSYGAAFMEIDSGIQTLLVWYTHTDTMTDSDTISKAYFYFLFFKIRKKTKLRGL